MENGIFVFVKTFLKILKMPFRRKLPKRSPMSYIFCHLNNYEKITISEIKSLVFVFNFTALPNRL